MNLANAAEARTQGMLACLAVPSRFRLVRAIAEADLCVGELALRVGLSQSCTTRHLQALERAGLVERHREGRRVRYRLHPEAGASRRLLDVVLGGELPLPVAATGPSPSQRPHRGRLAQSSGLGKSLPKGTLRDDGSVRADDRDAVRPEAHDPRDTEPPDGNDAPTRPFRRQVIEDYLL